MNRARITTWFGVTLALQLSPFSIFLGKAVRLYHVDVDQAGSQPGTSRSQIVQKLNDWNEDNTIVLRTSGLQHVYRIEKSLPATESERKVIADTLFAQMLKRERQDMERTQDVLRLMTDTTCISRNLAKYFGDFSEGLPAECGHCTWCETHEAAVVAPRPTFDDKAGIGRILMAFVERDDPRFLAKIAFGIASPRITALKYSSHPLFGSLDTADFPVNHPFP